MGEVKTKAAIGYGEEQIPQRKVDMPGRWHI